MSRRPRLIAEWRHVLRYAWSVRLLIVAGALSSAEAVLTVFPDQLHLPRAVLAMIVPPMIGLAFGARLLAQRSMDDDKRPRR